MHHVQITDDLFSDAQRGAKLEGFPSVEAFIAHAVKQRVHENEAETPNWMLLELDKGIADLESGRKVSLEEVDASFSKRRKEWLEKNT